MRIDKELLDGLTSAAKTSLRQRMNYDLRTPSDVQGEQSRDTSQRMLNALEPTTKIPIHRHTRSTECVVMLRGKGVQYYYDDAGNVTDEILLEADGPCRMMSVEKGRWHRLESLETGTIIFESKDGLYEPLSEEDMMIL